MMLSSLLYALIGGLTFRIRGGLRIPFTDKKFPLNKWWFAIWFASLACILKGWNWHLALTCFIAGYMCTAISGWGSYIGALYTGQISENDKDDLNITDFVQNTWFPKVLKKDYKEHGKLYGFWCLTFRGGLTTFILGLAVNSILYCCVGLLQGLVYWFGGWTCRNIYDDGKNGWKISEWYWGFVLCLFLSVVICVIF